MRRFAFALTLAVTLVCNACPGPVSPTPDADASGIDAGALIEAGVAAGEGVCEFIAGIDPSGVVRTICATVEELITLVGPYIATLLAKTDGGVPVCTKSSGTAMLPAKSPVDGGGPTYVVAGDVISNQLIPHTNVCASSAHRAEAILYLARVRAARFMLDGGAVHSMH